jgi:hypothetical protein
VAAWGGKWDTRCAAATAAKGERPRLTANVCSLYFAQVVNVDTPGVTQSYKMYQVEQVASDMKEAVTRTSENRVFETEGGTFPTVVYEVRTTAQ